MYTNHSLERAKERTRYSGKTAMRFIENGIIRGKSANDFKQDEKNYLVKIAYDNCIAKAYNGYCLIISENGDCVTLYRLPKWFGKKRYYDKKNKIHNIKKYRSSLPIAFE